MLTGSVRATGGDVLICGQSVEDNLRLCQSRIGYCPQYNPLFAKLTAREHLQIYGRIKLGQSQDTTEIKRQLEAEIAELAAQVGIAAQLDTVSKLRWSNAHMLEEWDSSYPIEGKRNTPLCIVIYSYSPVSEVQPQIEKTLLWNLLKFSFFYLCFHFV